MKQTKSSILSDLADSLHASLYLCKKRIYQSPGENSQPLLRYGILGPRPFFDFCLERQGRDLLLSVVLFLITSDLLSNQFKMLKFFPKLEYTCRSTYTPKTEMFSFSVAFRRDVQSSPLFYPKQAP